VKRLELAALLLLACGLACGLAGGSACGSDAEPPEDAAPPPDDERTFDQCAGDAPSFVRQAFLALDGRRPRSQAEVDVYADLYRRAAEQGQKAPEIVARAIMKQPELTERWVDVVMDALQVQRLDVQSERSCWSGALRGTVTPALTMAVCDNPASQPADGMPFTMLDLARSSIALGDLTPIYRGELFALAARPPRAPNAGIVEAELARRADFGARFDASYLHRDTVCLGCHTSESSVTNSDDPAIDRHWPVAGDPEKAVYGAPSGVAAERAHAVFRVNGLLYQGGPSGVLTRPWG